MNKIPKPKQPTKKCSLPFFSLLLKSGSWDRKKLLNDFVKTKNN